jgi:hypothetical protein
MDMSNSLIPQLLYPQGKRPTYERNKRTGRLQKRSGHFGREKNHMFLLGSEPWPIQPILRHNTGYPILASSVLF